MADPYRAPPQNDQRITKTSEQEGEIRGNVVSSSVILWQANKNAGLNEFGKSRRVGIDR